MNEQTQQKTRQEIEAHIIAKAWKDEAYKQELLNNSKAVIEQEFGLQLADDINVQVVEEDASSLYLVLPMQPDLSTDEVSEEELEAVAGGGRIGKIVKAARNGGKAVGDAAKFVGGAVEGAIDDAIGLNDVCEK